MATQDFETLRTRVQPLGGQLFVDNSVDGDPRMHIHDPKTEKHVMAGVQANEIKTGVPISKPTSVIAKPPAA